MSGKTIFDKAFSALANSHRRAIITALSLQPLSISQLAEFEKLSLPAIHKHIAVLEEAQLVHRRKIGRSNFLVLNHESFQLVQKWLLQHQTHWGSAQATLENYEPKNYPSALTSSLPNSRTGSEDS